MTSFEVFRNDSNKSSEADCPSMGGAFSDSQYDFEPYDAYPVMKKTETTAQPTIVGERPEDVRTQAGQYRELLDQLLSKDQ